MKNGKGKKITVIDSNGKETTNIYPIETIPAGISISGAVLTANTKFTGNSINLADYATTVTKANVSALSKGISIVGSSAANSIKGGKATDTIQGGNGNDTLFGGSGNDKLYGGEDNDSLSGGSGNDTLYGGKGNDTLTGGAGNDVFVYESGNDVITDYAAGQDTIKISNGTITKTAYSGKNVIFTIGSGTLTVQNGKGKKITITDSSNKTTTTTYREVETEYSHWFMEDDNNYISNDTRINDISAVDENNYATGKIETLNYQDLAQDKPIVTYTK